MTWMLRLYPRGWRRRYGGEVEMLVASEDRTLRLFLDLLAGAIDARLNPQRTPEPAPEKGSEEMSGIRRLCASGGFTRREQVHSAAWMLGATAGLVLLALGLERFFELTVLSQAVLYAALPVAFILSSRGTYLKAYSAPVRRVLLVGGVVGMFLFMLAVTWFADRF